MPVYCYRNRETGEPIELAMTISEMEKRSRKDDSILHEGTVYDRDVASEHGGFINTSGAWPMTSEAAGVLPGQIKTEVERARSAGVSLDFTPDGSAIFRDRAHRKECLKYLGMHDRNGGYGDP